MRKSPLKRGRLVAASLASAAALGLAVTPVALGFSEGYGFYAIGNNGYVQSAGAHTFIYNTGGGSTGGQLACQLFNSKGVNEVSHGNGACAVISNGAYVWARVYNETGATETVGGEAET